MNVDAAVEIVRGAFWMTLLVGGPVLAVGFVAGILVSLVQILTSMQDPAFNTVPRLMVFLASTMLLLPWMADQLIDYTRRTLGGLHELVGP